MEMAAFERWQQLASSLPKSGRPLVTLAYAQSLDGSLTVRPGQPTQLSGSQSSSLTHRLRSEHDAILIGIGTLLADDPLLTARIPGGRDPQPVILDSQLRCPTGARLLTGNPRSAWIACLEPVDRDRAAALKEDGARLLPLPAAASGQVDLPSLLDCLGELGVRSLMVEGGAQVISSFLSQDLVDLVLITIAPLMLGGLHLFESASPGIPGMVSPLKRLRQLEFDRLGDDLIIVGTLRS